MVEDGRGRGQQLLFEDALARLAGFIQQGGRPQIQQAALRQGFLGLLLLVGQFLALAFDFAVFVGVGNAEAVDGLAGLRLFLFVLADAGFGLLLQVGCRGTQAIEPGNVFVARLQEVRFGDVQLLADRIQ